MNKEIINDLIPIPCTDREKLLKLRSLLIEIQSTWFDNLFDSGLTFADPIVWEKMQKAVCLMERRDNPSAKGFDLKSIASDYKKLEEIFIASEWSADQFLLNSDDFKACDLVRVHHFSAIGILKEVQNFIASRSAELVAIAEENAAEFHEQRKRRFEARTQSKDLDNAISEVINQGYILTDDIPDEDTAYEIISKGIIDDE